MDEDDKDIAAFLEANRQARRQKAVNWLRIAVAGLVACGVGFLIFGGIVDGLSESPDALYRRRGGYRPGELQPGMLILASALAVAAGLVLFLGVYRLVGGKVEKETWQAVGRILSAPFRR